MHLARLSEVLDFKCRGGLEISTPGSGRLPLRQSSSFTLETILMVGSLAKAENGWQIRDSRGRTFRQATS